MIGRTLIIIGIIFIILGLILNYSHRFPDIGRLPGDIVIKRENFTFYFPITTGIALSLLISLILYLINKFR